MTWEDKVEMVRLLNNKKNKEATDFYLQHEDWEKWDDVQALSMYATGIDFINPEDCRAFESQLSQLQTVHSEMYSNLDFRSHFRLALLQEKWKTHSKLADL